MCRLHEACVLRCSRRLSLNVCRGWGRRGRAHAAHGTPARYCAVVQWNINVFFLVRASSEHRDGADTGCRMYEQPGLDRILHSSKCRCRRGEPWICLSTISAGITRFWFTNFFSLLMHALRRPPGLPSLGRCSGSNSAFSCHIRGNATFGKCYRGNIGGTLKFKCGRGGRTMRWRRVPWQRGTRRVRYSLSELRVLFLPFNSYVPSSVDESEKIGG
jgi:hypothetical protein